MSEISNIHDKLHYGAPYTAHVYWWIWRAKFRWRRTWWGIWQLESWYELKKMQVRQPHSIVFHQLQQQCCVQGVILMIACSSHFVTISSKI